jgi:hypothetical protein
MKHTLVFVSIAVARPDLARTTTNQYRSLVDQFVFNDSAKLRLDGLQGVCSAVTSTVSAATPGRGKGWKYLQAHKLFTREGSNDIKVD